MWQQSLGVTITANKKYIYTQQISEKNTQTSLHKIFNIPDKKSPKKPHGGGGPWMMDHFSRNNDRHCWELKIVETCLK